MPMGIVSDAEFEKELNNSRPNKTRADIRPVTTLVKDSSDSSDSSDNTIERGRKEGDVNVPDSLRKLLGDVAVTSGRSDALALAKQFGISDSSVSAYSKGARSTATYNDRPSEKVINGAKMRVSMKARRKLLKALDSMTDDKLESCKARDLAGIAKDMAVVMKAMETDSHSGEGESNKGPTFMIFSPQFKSENDYKQVEAKE